MLLFERVVYDSVCSNCICPAEIKHMLDVNKSTIIKYAKKNRVDSEDVKKQIILHAPQFEKCLYTFQGFLQQNIFPILDKIFEDYPDKYQFYLEKCGAHEIDSQSLRVIWSKENGINIIKIENSNVILEMREVSKCIGNFLESDLHYLRSPRNESVKRVGLYIKGYDWPICYMSFTRIDRDDKIVALQKSLDRDIQRKKVIEMARVYGCGKLPRNAISLLVGAVSKELRQCGYDYIVTAVNITMGFSGHSIVASNFVPYAIRPVKYLYDPNGKYCTARKCIATKQSINTMPPNILYVKDIKNNWSRKRQYCKLVDISNDYAYNWTAI